MKKIALLAIGCIVATVLWAKPARRGALVVTQEDGTEAVVYQHGDERFHWTTNEAGEWIEQDADGKWQLVSALSDNQIQARRETSKFAIAEQERLRKQTATKKAVETNIAEHGLVILVEFPDMAFKTTQAEMDSMHNGYNYTRDYSYTFNRTTFEIHAEGSARQYFYDASFGQYNPKFDVVGPVQVSQKYSYYGANDTYGNDLHAEQMVYEACLLVDSLYPEIDFSLYDNNGDGEMDYVYVIYAGYGEADGGLANTIWPHSYWIHYAGYNLTIDGVKIDKYACGNEIYAISKEHDGIGTFVHEFGHVLGLPDLYATDGSTHRTLDDWDVMDFGNYNNDGNNPPTYSAYERFFFGWLTPTLIKDTALLTLHDIYSTNEAFLISPNDRHNLIGNDPDTTVFYLLENRQPNIWDNYLVGHGMMLTKIRYDYTKWYYNTVNNTKSKLGVDIIEAKPNTLANTNLPTDLFPAGATEYTKISGHPIYNIRQTEDGQIQFAYLSPDAVESIEEIELSVDNPVVAVYTLTGMPISLSTSLPSGLYIVKRQHSTEKVIIR